MGNKVDFAVEDLSGFDVNNEDMETVNLIKSTPLPNLGIVPVKDKETGKIFKCLAVITYEGEQGDVHPLALLIDSEEMFNNLKPVIGKDGEERLEGAD